MILIISIKYHSCILGINCDHTFFKYFLTIYLQNIHHLLEELENPTIINTWLFVKNNWIYYEMYKLLIEI